MFSEGKFSGVNSNVEGIEKKMPGGGYNDMCIFVFIYKKLQEGGKTSVEVVGFENKKNASSCS